MPEPTLEEIVTIVDEENRVVGAAPRSRMRADGLPHRATYILVFNDEGELFVQKRTTVKDIYPGYHDVATGGVVLSGESYEDAAKRELAEELGITGVRLKGHFDFLRGRRQPRMGPGFLLRLQRRCYSAGRGSGERRLPTCA